MYTWLLLVWWKFSAQDWSHPETFQSAGKARGLLMHPVDSCHAVPLKSSLNAKIVSMERHPTPSRLSSPASFQSMLATPCLVCSELSCSCCSFCVLSPVFTPVDHSTASLLLEMALDYFHKRQEVREVNYRPRCLWQHCSLPNKDVWAGVPLSSWQAAWGPEYSRANEQGPGRQHAP